jgi:hypothetical protein
MRVHSDFPIDSASNCEFGNELLGVTCSLGSDNQKCPNNYVCKVARDQASTVCCPTRRECSMSKCKFMKCPYGFARDENGCRKCECNEPCKNVKCGLNKFCVVQMLKSPSKNILNKFIGKCVLRS